MFEWINILFLVGGALVTMIIALIKKSYGAGVKNSELATKIETDEKIKSLREEINDKFEEIDDKIEKKFNDIDKNLNRINETLIKLDTRDTERQKYEKDIKKSEKESLDRICDFLMQFDKKQDDLYKTVAEHSGYIKTKSFIAE